MFKVYCNDKVMGLLTTVNIFKDSEQESITYFNEYYANKYEFLNIVECKNNKCA